MSRNALLGLIDSLESTVRKLRWRPGRRRLGLVRPGLPVHRRRRSTARPGWSASCWSGPGRRASGTWAPTPGHFSRMAAGLGASVAAFDFDAACIERMYLEARGRDETRLLPLVLDLFNPSPASGWMNRERASIFDRGRPDLVMALALIHHLAIVGNQPLPNLAEFFRRLRPLAPDRVRPGDRPAGPLPGGAAGRRPPCVQPRDVRAMLQPTFRDHRRRSRCRSRAGSSTCCGAGTTEGMGGLSAHLSAAVRRLPDPGAVRPERAARSGPSSSSRSWPARSPVAGVLWLVFGLLLKDAAKGALVVAAAIVMFYTVRPPDGADGDPPDLPEHVLDREGASRGRTLCGSSSPSWRCSAASPSSFGGSGTSRNATRFLNVLAFIAVAMPVIQILSVKAPDAARPARQPEPMALARAARDGPPARYLLHHPRRLRAARRDEVALRLRQHRVPGAPGAARVSTSRGAARPTTARPPSASPARSTRPTSTTWSRDWATTRPS